MGEMKFPEMKIGEAALPGKPAAGPIHMAPPPAPALPKSPLPPVKPAKAPMPPPIRPRADLRRDQR
jgi:hypothetical protein